MIHVEPQPEPSDFDAKVRRRGLQFLSRHPEPSTSGWRNHDYWRKILPALYEAYHRICAYSCHWIPPDTGGRSVEHFLPKTKYPDRAYEWSNYRLVCLTLNGRKGDHEDVLDPFVVEDGWFVLDFPSLQIKPSADLDMPSRRRVQTTIERLCLNDEGTCLRNRSYYIRDYCQGEINFSHLRRCAPFVAMELERQKLVEAIREMMGTDVGPVESG
ncbi:MAG: hypothetical protein GY856_51990 [bacterium]|nr:hypothetical protein [bacterium]